MVSFWGIEFNLQTAAIIFIVPFGVLLITALLHDRFGQNLNSVSELFAFLLALDITFLITYDTSVTRINQYYAPNYLVIFGMLLLESIIFLIVSAKVQEWIYQSITGETETYPFVTTVICWLGSLSSIGFHCFIILG